VAARAAAVGRRFPWLADVRRVFDLLAGDFKGTHGLFLVNYTPLVPMARFELLYQPGQPLDHVFRDPPAVLLGVVETLTRAEVQRQAAEERYRQDMVSVVVKSLEEGDKRPLFAPDTLYTVSVTVKAQIRKADKPSEQNAQTITQKFRFRTAATAPARLNPWVLAMLPENDAATHFSLDPVAFIFNDASVVQLFKAFGRTLTAVLRKANGNHPDERPAIDLPSLHPTKGVIGTPYATTMSDLVLELPCVPGIVEIETHQVFTVDIPLERGTSYILDIESTPPCDDAITPLFRTAFTTSRYMGAAELATLVQAGFVEERALKAGLSLAAQDDRSPHPRRCIARAHAGGPGANRHGRRDGSGAYCCGGQ
jgi:hypothetical protein